MCDKKDWVLDCLAPTRGQLAEGFYNAGVMLADDRSGIIPESSRMQLIYNATEADFDAYVALLKASGANVYLERNLGNDKFLAFAQNGKYYHVSFLAKRGEIRVIEEVETTSLAEFGYDKKGDKKTVFYQYALYYDPENNVTDTTVNCGMLYVIKLSDNSLFMVDGGHIRQCSDEMMEGLWKFLLRITDTPEDGAIRIAGWYFTHAHDDHTDGCTKLLNHHHDRIALERVLFNFPYCGYMGGYSTSIYGAFEAIAKYYPQVKVLKLHTGQEFTLADMKVEVFYAHEDLAERKDLDRVHFGDSNCMSSILKLTIDGKTIMMLGDTNVETEDMLKKYGDGSLWEADMVQVAHHCFNYLDTVYEWIHAPVAVVPNSHYGANRWDNIGKLAGVLKWVKDDQVYYEGSATYGFVATEKGFKQVETYPLIGGSYDFSGF